VVQRLRMSSKANHGQCPEALPIQEELEQLRTEIEALREENTTLQKTNAQQAILLLQLQGETKEDSSLVPPSSKKARFAYISQIIIPQFQPSVDPVDIPYEQIAWWKDIFSYIQPNDYERLHLRRLCNMFKASLKAPPKGIFTAFPHPNYTSLWSLMNRLNQLYEENPSRAPTIFFINEGVHTCLSEDEEDDDNDLIVTYPMQIIGAGRDQTFVKGGGFFITGTQEEGKRVDMQGMTMKGSSQSGLWAENGLSFLCKNMTFTQCGYSGVFAENTKGKLINCVITQCGFSGILCRANALIELEGSQTKVDGNVTRLCSHHYGLVTCDTSSIIHLLFPLTKESVSTNNQGGGNYLARGTIETVDSL
jgi:hypothetical protein